MRGCTEAHQSAVSSLEWTRTATQIELGHATDCWLDDAVPAPTQADDVPKQAPEQNDVDAVPEHEQKDGEAAAAEASKKQDMEPASKRQRVPATDEETASKTPVVEPATKDGKASKKQEVGPATKDGNASKKQDEVPATADDKASNEKIYEAILLFSQTASILIG